MFSKDFPVWYYGDSPISQAKGVAIGFARGVRFELEERITDPEGRYLFLRGKLNGFECSLANFYGPNKNANRYLLGALEKFMEFKKGGAIIAGDFNFYFEPGRDSTSHARGTGGVWMNKLKKTLHQYQLVDAWRMQHNNERDYTFYSPVHATYSRLDFFLVEHWLLEVVISTNIGITTLSDHVPVSLQIKIGESQKKCNIWR